MANLEITFTSDGRITLVGHADIHNAEKLYRGLEALLEKETTPSRLCLEGLESIDTAGLQVLLAFLKLIGPERVQVDPCPPAITETITLLGLGGWLTRH